MNWKGKLIALLAMVSLAAGVVGCDDQRVTVNSDQNGDQESDSDNADGAGDHHHGDGDYAESHGPDEDEVLVEPGLFNGSWRVALEADDRPLVYFDLFQDEGEATANGDFLMGMALGEMLDGTPGELMEVVIEGDVITVTWNPTMDIEEIYYVEATKETDDKFVGSFRAEKNPRIDEVIMTRRTFEDDSDREPFED